MSIRQLLFKSLWMLSVIATLVGFTFQSWKVLTEYFEYRTSSFVAIEDYPEKGIEVPGIAICFTFKRPKGRWMVGQLFTGKEDYLNDKNDTWRLTEISPNLPPKEERKMKYITKKFLFLRKYCFFFQLLNQFNMDRINTRYILPLFYSIFLTSTPIHSPNVRGYDDNDCQPKWAYFKIVVDESTLANPRNREATKGFCSRGVVSYYIGLTYSSLVNVRLPPPHDTNCLDYQKAGPFLSSYDCYDECLKQQTKGNFATCMTILDRKKYKESEEEYVASDYIEHEDTLDSTLTLDDEDTLNSTLTLNHERKEYVKKLQRIWKKHKTFCRQVCFRPDCRSEDISPQLFDVEEWEKKDNASLEKLNFELLTSYQPTIKVSSTPKQQLLDLIVYMCSNLSFWLGFCPLTVAEMVIGRLRKRFVKKNPGSQVDSSLERKVRDLLLQILTDSRNRGNIRNHYSFELETQVPVTSTGREDRCRQERRNEPLMRSMFLTR